MTWSLVLEIIAEECDEGTAKRIERRLRHELGGLRVTVYKKPKITRALIDSIAPGRPTKAAKILGVHRSTIYRALIR